MLIIGGKFKRLHFTNIILVMGEKLMLPSSLRTNLFHKCIIFKMVISNGSRQSKDDIERSEKANANIV